MALPLSPITWSDLPSDAILAVADQATRDAEAVGHFLDVLAERWKDTPVGPWFAQRPRHLPAHFLLGLGSALGLLRWEQQGIDVHRQAGLPCAREAIRSVFRAVTDTEEATRVADLCSRMTELFVTHFAWAGPIELHVDITLGEAEEEIVLEALADFLWAHRPR